jgi:LuxR family transcriptional regulator of csgAB operon
MLLELKTYNIKKKSNNHIIVLNVPPNVYFTRQIILQGVHGFFYDHDSVDNIIKGIKSVIEGGLWFPREMMCRCILEENEPKPLAKHIVGKLTRRQIEILSMIAVGKTNQEIAETLFISPHTVKNHLYQIFKKIHVSNRIQASLWAAINL